MSSCVVELLTRGSAAAEVPAPPVTAGPYDICWYLARGWRPLGRSRRAARARLRQRGAYRPVVVAELGHGVEDLRFQFLRRVAHHDRHSVLGECVGIKVAGAVGACRDQGCLQRAAEPAGETEGALQPIVAHALVAAF